MSELVSTRIRSSAGKLGLPHPAETLAQYAQRADEAELGYLDVIDLVLSEELAVREVRRFRIGLRTSKLPHHKTLEDYDFSFQPELDSRKVKDLATLSFVESKANGPARAARSGQDPYRRRVGGRGLPGRILDLLHQPRRHGPQPQGRRDGGAADQQARQLSEAAVLVLDEAGYQPLNRDEATLVFQVISKRYERGSIILTSNKAFSEWDEFFGDEVLATAILDRLLHHCGVISINGPSYRLKNRLAAIEREQDDAA